MLSHRIESSGTLLLFCLFSSIKICFAFFLEKCMKREPRSKEILTTALNIPPDGFQRATGSARIYRDIFSCAETLARGFLLGFSCFELFYSSWKLFSVFRLRTDLGWFRPTFPLVFLVDVGLNSNLSKTNPIKTNC